MIPTFFGISLITFVILNFAPGHPGGTQLASDFSQTMKSEQTRESMRIFREQFNLDKPVIFNHYLMSLSAEKILDKIKIITKIKKAEVSQQIKSQNDLDDYGHYSIPYLIKILKTHQEKGSEENILINKTVIYYLRSNAKRKLIRPYAKNQTEEERALNRKISKENAYLRSLKLSDNGGAEEIRSVITNWLDWYEKHDERWQYSFIEKLEIMFLDTRFAKYWGNLLTLDFGISLVTKEPVIETIFSKLKYSISMSITSIILAYLISIPIGIFSAVDKDSLADRSTTSVLFMLYSLPSFFVGTLLLFYFSMASEYPALRIFPIGGWRGENHMELTAVQQILDVSWHLVLPLVCLTYGSFAVLSRYMKAGLLDVLHSDYIRTARAKGLAEPVVILKHALRNGLFPILTLLSSLLPAILGGSVIIEVIFAIPGMGSWMIDSIFQRDYNVIMAVQLISTVLVLIGILLSDISYSLVDPRVRLK